MNIVLTRAEGPSHECDKPHSCTSFFDADLKLKHWSYSAPENGGYNKCDFVITDDAAGIEYKGRYDLKHWRVECANLRAHVIGNLEFLAGDSRPSHMTQERYDAFLTRYTAEQRAEFRAVAAFFQAKPL